MAVIVSATNTVIALEEQGPTSAKIDRAGGDGTQSTVSVVCR